MAPAASSEWTPVRSRRKDRTTSARKSGEDHPVNEPAKLSTGYHPRVVRPPSNHIGRWRKVPQPSLSMASTIQQRSVSLLNEWYNKIKDLGQKNSTEVVEFLVQNWEAFYILLKNERFHEETASFVQAMAVLSQSDELTSVEFIILMVLARVKITELPQNCKNVRFFLALSRIFASFSERGSRAAKLWIHGRRWVLILIGVADKHLSCKEAESVLSELQAIDEDLSRLAVAENRKSHTAIEKNIIEASVPSAKTLQKATKSIGLTDQNGNNVASIRSNDFVEKKTSSMASATGKTSRVKLGVLKLDHNTDTQRNATGENMTDECHTLKRKGKTSKTKGFAFVQPRQINEQNRVHAVLHNTKVSLAQKEALLTKLKRNWSPHELPCHLETLMKCVLPEQRHINSKLCDFITDVCRSPLVENLWEFLNVKRGVTPNVVQDITKFCSVVSRACPDIFSGYFEGIIEMTLQAAEECSQSPFLKKQIVELRGNFVRTKYVSELPDMALESFREMSVVPTSEDFQQKEVFLRPNIINGPYSSEEHYLDVQFRLLREDFLKPLRDGVAEIRGRVKVFEQSEDKRFNAMRIYKNVTFQRKSPSGITMSFDPERKLNIDWRISKRFMVGALLVISNDNFATLHLARVLRKDIEGLSAGWLVVEPLWSEASVKRLCQGSFVVGESMVFFEPYLHVLRVLQNVREGMFPLARYIVYSDPTVELPDYLQIDQNRRFRISLGAVGVERELDIVSDQWPTPAEMGLNDSQHEALIRALTQKVMLVQGPPGTGKTFLGLRIVSTLLKNPHAWRGTGGSASPILIVCYTNHALDQFLVGLLNTTKKIVRLGGRCKDQRLEDYMLKKNEDTLSRELKRLMWERHREKDVAQEELECIQAAARALADNVGIVSWDTFKTYNVIPAELDDVPPDFSVVSWLEEGIPDVQLSEDDKRFLRQNPKWGNKCFAFEDTFSNILRSIEELQQYGSGGRLVYEHTLQFYNAKLQYLQQVAHGQLSDSVLEGQITNILDLNVDQRSQLYRYWVSKLKVVLTHAERHAQTYLRDCEVRIKQVRMLKDKELIAENLIVGMTTTKAAAMQPLLQALKPGIVIVEEAAEVLESHIIAALTPHVQHLILLGDHKQLRPSPADHEVGTNFKLEVSLFERMCNNNMPCKTLNIQHRMRPEISALIQFIYPGLENHSSVSKYPAIRGLKSSMFFVDHRMPEQQMDELMSHCNPHEATFIAALVTYLLLQGYEDSQITVLTAYSGQLMYLKGLEHEYPCLRRVHVCNVDNFQGEESDIILLSLVRSNPQNFIGFLKTENRVCVALSRAKHGMIVIGNLKSLTASSETWRHVRSTLDSQQAVGKSLTLRCAKHPEQTLKVKGAADFRHWTNGGCEIRCDFKLRCRHECPLACHRDRLDHQGIVCLEQCNKMVCNKDHPPYFCTDLCYKPCEPCNADKYVELKCGHLAKMKCWQNPDTFVCTMYKDVTLEACGHTAKMLCSKDPKAFLCMKKEMRLLEGCGHENLVVCFKNGPCNFPCKAKLECGHLCARDCHTFDDPLHHSYQCSEPCRKTRPGCSAEHKHPCTLKCRDKCADCDILVTKALPCHHNINMPCSQPATQDRCKARCLRKRACKHPCKNPCGQECGNCEVEVQKKHPVCGHKLTMPCYADPGEQLCTQPCEKIVLPCSHKCSKKCGLDCHPCSEKVLKKMPYCDHSIEVACGIDVEVECPERCTKKLPCGHRCHAGCADPCQRKCSKPVKCPSPCGHSVKVPCSERDDWSSADSSLALMSRCKKECRIKLTCGHQCKGSCFECYQGRLHRPCDEKCNKLLLCGHRCQDTCGLPCLPCKQPCPVKCVHSKCTKHCGQQCTSCSKNCEMGKPIFKCERKCREKCTWSPTKKPCPFPIRKCKHDCIGLEGDPCPNKCRQCDKDSAELENSSEQDRFIELSDCGHIVRFNVMEKLIIERPSVVRLPSCPTCKVPVSNSSRYGNVLKVRQEHIVVIYKELALCTNSLKDMKNALTKLKRLDGTADSNRRTKQLNACAVIDSPKTYRLMMNVREAMKTAEGGQPSDEQARRLRGLCTYAEVLYMLDGCLRSMAKDSDLRDKIAGQVDRLSAALAARPCVGFSAQEILDVNTELLRIQRLQQLCAMEKQAEAAVLCLDTDYREASKILRACGPYPRKTMDDSVWRTIDRLAKSNPECDVNKQWWKELPLPRSAAEGFWYLCGKGHPYPKTDTGRNCRTCQKVSFGEDRDP